jgi:DNA-binding beta-propeller fold protein YncE
MRTRAILLFVVIVTSFHATSAADPIQLPNGLAITPTAAPHSAMLPLNPHADGRPDYALAQPVSTALSPDGKRLLVLTSGYNKERGVKDAQTSEFVLIYDASVFPVRFLQALPLPNTFCGMEWNPNGNEFYVSGGVDDKIYIFGRNDDNTFSRHASVALGHAHGKGLLSNLAPPNDAQAPKPMVGGIAVNSSGTVALVANFYNDSVSVVDLKSRKTTGELDLRPGASDKSKAGVAGGEYPYWIAIRGEDTAWISSPRDREIVVLRLAPSIAVTARIPIQGQPNRILVNKSRTRLYAAVDNADEVAVIDTAANKVTQMLGVVAPSGMLSSPNLPRGANPNSLAISPDERTLYVTDGGTNAVAVVDLDSAGAGKVRGLIPTGWYPNAVAASADGKYLYVANSKSVPGPNPGDCRGDVKAPGIPDCTRKPGDYVYELQKGSLLVMPIPGPVELDALTRRVSENNHFDRVRTTAPDPVIAAVRSHIQHVIYIVKENRTYDQVLGDLEVGDGDPSLAEFPEALGPNHHSLARNFVTLDNFLDSGEVSGVGWNWSVAARTTDYTEKTVPPEYAGRGFMYDWEGTNRGINVGIGTLPERVKAQPLLGTNPDPDLLPGAVDVAAPDSDAGDAGSGYIWDEALRAGLTVRNYGFFCDLSRYENPKANPGFLPNSKTPFADGKLQAISTNKSLMALTDPYFRSFDQNAPDYYRFKEWEREFDAAVQSGKLPNLTLLRFAHDHFGSFGTAEDGINTPALEFADNDYAVGMVMEKLFKSPFAGNTLVFVVEDDAQDGPDHVDAHRSDAYVIGPYVKQHAVVSERYTTVSMVHTIEAVLGLSSSSIYAAASAPMSEVFDLGQSTWSYKALVPAILRTSHLPLPAATAENTSPARTLARDTHDAKYWQRRLGDMDYDVEDKLDVGRFNRELWKGMMGTVPYPDQRSGKDLRGNREALLDAGASLVHE